MPEWEDEVEDRVRQILDLLVDDAGPEVIRVGKIPSAALSHWPERLTDDVVITRRQRIHYLEQHPEMIAFERELILALLDPYEVHSIGPGGATAILIGKQDASHDSGHSANQ